MKLLKYLFALLTLSTLVACGGGGGSPGLSSGATPLPLFTTAPSSLTLAVGGVASEYRISGGSAPYQVASSNIQVVVSTLNEGVLTIRGIAKGTASVVVSDSRGATTTISVIVDNLAALFTNAPSTIKLSPFTSVNYTVGGGVPDYSVTADDARIVSVSLSGTTLSINALAVGNAGIIVRDASGQTVTLFVNVGSLMALYTTAPSSFTIAKDTQRSFTVSGGVPGYAVESTDTRIVAATLTGSVLNIRGVAAGSANVLIHDTVNGLVTLTVTVGGASPIGLFTSAPGQLTVAKGTQSVYSVGGGVAGYSAESSDTRIATVSLSGGTMVISAVAFGSATITIRDAAGSTLTVSLTVASGTPGDLFTTAPSSLSMGAGTSLTFLVSGGAQPYYVVSSDARVVIGSIVGSSLTITALQAGSAALQIVDAMGRILQVVVTVNGTSGGPGGPAAIEILASSNALPSAVGSKVTFVITVKDAVNSAIPNQVVTFTATSGILTGASPAPSTDANGTITTISLSPGADLSNRTITVTATAGSVSKSINIAVVGTTVSISGAGSALVGNPASTYSVKALDSGGKPIAGAAITVTSSAGNTIAPPVVTTDLSGAATFSFTPIVAGTDTLTASGMGASASTTVVVSNEDFAFTAPLSAANLVVNTFNTVTVRYRVGGVGVAGKTVTFSTTRGTLGSSTSVTNASGDASTLLISSTAGPVTVSAQLGTARSSVTAAFIATVPATIVLQANPSAVLPNPSGSTANQSTLSATVRDSTGNPVAGQVVNFTAIQDGSNGTIIPGSGTTDSNGMTSVQFIPGALSTPANGVLLRATVQSAPGIFAETPMTVNGDALFISIGIGSTLTVLDAVTYQKDFSVYVTDANGVAAANRSVTVSVFPPTYGKGSLAYNLLLARWVYAAAPTGCANEDLNRNGILDGGEDINGNGQLDPGLPVALSPATLTTDANGYATFQMRFGKNYAWWLTTEVKARALVGGTESSRTATYDLEMTAADVASPGTPPNVVSPFGQATLCTNPL